MYLLLILSNSPFVDEPCKVFKAPVIGSFSILGKTTRWKLPHFQMIFDTFTAYALSRAWLIGAIASLEVVVFLTFHILSSGERLNIQFLYLQCVGLNELAPWLYLFTHEGCKQVFGLVGIFYGNLQHVSLFRIHGGLP